MPTPFPARAGKQGCSHRHRRYKLDVSMKRLAVDLLLVLVAACSSSDRTNQEVLGNGRPTLFAPADAPVAAGSAAASVTAAADAAREHALREEVAIGSEPETASLLLAGDLCAAERYEE